MMKKNTLIFRYLCIFLSFLCLFLLIYDFLCFTSYSESQIFKILFFKYNWIDESMSRFDGKFNPVVMTIALAIKCLMVYFQFLIKNIIKVPVLFRLVVIIGILSIVFYLFFGFLFLLGSHTNMNFSIISELNRIG